MAEVKVTLNAAALGKINTAVSKSLVMTAQELLNRARNAAVFPMDTGELQNEDTSVDDSNASNGKVEIVTNSPKARRLYFHPEYNFRTDHNSNAGGEWWEPWISGDRKNEPKQIFSQFLKKEGGGVIK